MVLSINELMQSSQWDLIGKSDVGSFLDGLGNSLINCFVVGLISLSIGSAFKIHEYNIFWVAYVLGGVLTIGALSIYIGKAKGRLLKIWEIFLSDIETQNLLKARKLIEHYEPKRFANINWSEVEKAYADGKPNQSIVPLIVALESMRKSFHGKAITDN